MKKGNLIAHAVVRRGTYDARKKYVPLDLEVSQGPRVKLMVTGAKFSKGELKRLVPVYQEGAVDADLLEEGKRNIAGTAGARRIFRFERGLHDGNEGDCRQPKRLCRHGRNNYVYGGEGRQAQAGEH